MTCRTWCRHWVTLCMEGSVANEQDSYDSLFEASGQIDHLHLDNSILDQPQLFGHCTRWAAHFISKRDKLKHDVSVTESRVQLRVRAELSGDKKPTEATVAAMVAVDPETEEAYARYFKAKDAAQRWESLVDTFRQRSYSLNQYISWRSGDYIHESVGFGDREASQRALSRRVRQ